jgi:hypothetical protein
MARTGLALASLPLAFAVMAGAALGQAPAAPSTSPSTATSSSPTPAPPGDPCGSILSIVNRPTVTTGVCTVRTGRFDVETGYTNTTVTGPASGSNANYPQSLIRVGTANPHFDLEFGPPSHETSSIGQPTITGSSDVNLGAKYEAGYSSNADWGVNAVVALPTGSKAFTAGNAQFTGNLNGAYTINSEFSLAGTLSINTLSGSNSAGSAQSYFAFIPSLELSAALPGGPSQISAEYAYFSAAGPGLGSKSLIDFVYQRDIGSHLQFDVEYGLSPTLVGGQKQHYIGAGLSFMN